jgi:hypothetical protein
MAISTFGNGEQAKLRMDTAVMTDGLMAMLVQQKLAQDKVLQLDKQTSLEIPSTLAELLSPA